MIQLQNAYENAVKNNDHLAMSIIYTRIKNLGYILVKPDILTKGEKTIELS